MAKVHVVNLMLVKVDAAGNIINTGGNLTNISNPTEGTVISSPIRVPEYTTEYRVMENDDVPNSLNSPTIPEYLAAEATDDYVPVHLTQNILITLYDAINIEASDIQIGAVELKDHDSATRADISAAGAAGGNGLHSFVFTDVAGNVRYGLVDANRRVTVSPIPGQIGVAADAGDSDAATPRVIIANDNPTYEEEGEASPAYTEQVGGKYEAVPTAVDDGDLGPFLIDAYKKPVNPSYNSSVGADQTLEQAPVEYDGSGAEIRAPAVLPAAGAYDAAPTELPLGGMEKVHIQFFYDEDAGAANGAGKYMVEICETISGTDDWSTLAGTELQAVILGADVAVNVQGAEFTFDPTGAAEEGVSVILSVGRASKIRIPCAECGDVANPGQASVNIRPHN